MHDNLFSSACSAENQKYVWLMFVGKVWDLQTRDGWYCCRWCCWCWFWCTDIKSNFNEIKINTQITRIEAERERERVKKGHIRTSPHKRPIDISEWKYALKSQPHRIESLHLKCSCILSKGDVQAWQALKNDINREI